MTARKRRRSPAKPREDDPKALVVTRHGTDSTADALAHASLRPTVQAALTLMKFNNNFGEPSINTLVDDLGTQCRMASDGDLQRAEAMLTAQAHTLDAIFHNLAQRASLNMGEYLNAAETYMRLALKAQSQCRATLLVLASLKNPASVAFVKQANIAHGPQQVNNGGRSETSPKENSEKPQNKLLEQTHGERLDFGAKGAAGRADKDVGAVAKIDRADDD